VPHRRPAAEPFAGAGLSSARLDELRREAKRALRQRLGSLRAALPAGAIAARSGAACARLAALPAMAGARSVALYAAIASRRELDLGHLDGELRSRGVEVYYPFLDRTGSNGRTGFRRTATLNDLCLREHRFPEPPADAQEAAPGSLDVIVVPALGFDPRGHRLGYGAGWYDVTLPEHAPPAVTVVAGFDFQLLVEIPNEPHDVACQVVVTDARVLDAEKAVGVDPPALR
jgi:5-formyltetrahydrofolate cyclo-ligase